VVPVRGNNADAAVTDVIQVSVVDGADAADAPFNVTVNC
jgi:hypothetical protein